MKKTGDVDPLDRKFTLKMLQGKGVRGIRYASFGLRLLASSAPDYMTGQTLVLDGGVGL